MKQSLIDITSQLPLEKLSSQEVAIILRQFISGSSHSSEDPHIVNYGNAFKVRYKSGERRILKVTASKDYWTDKKKEILTEFKKAINPNDEKIFSRVVFTRGKDLYTPPFKWSDIFQLGRIPDGNPKPKYSSGLFPCLFQFKVPVTGSLSLDNYRGQEFFRKTFLPLIPLLRQYCTTNIQYDNKSTSKKAWAVSLEEDEIETQYVQLDYFLNTDVSEDSFFSYAQPKARQLPIENHDFHWFGALDLSRGYLAYESLSNENKELFLLGCEWFNKAITASDDTDSFLFIMIMLEIFLPNDSEPCDECGQPVYSINQKFKTYIPDVIGKKWTSNFETTLGKLYSLRCKIAHQGIALAQYSAGLLPLEIKERRQLEYSIDLARQFLVSWLFMKLKEHKDKGEANNN